MLNKSVIKLLKNGMWDLATCADGEPNVVPVAFKNVTDDGKLYMAADYTVCGIDGNYVYFWKAHFAVIRCQQ